MNIERLKEIVTAYKQELLLIGISLSVIIISLLFMVYSRSTSSDISISSKTPLEKTNTSSSVIVVDIAGAIESPDIYTMSAGSRLKELIALAGGVSNDADYIYVAKNINMASKLIDQQKIYIPFNYEYINAISGSKTDKNVLGVMNINIATPNELDSLPGVGSVTAQKILDNRPFISVDELLDKKILKTNIFEQVKNMISVN